MPDKGREADLEHLRDRYNKTKDPRERREIEQTAQSIRKESGTVRSMREALIREHRQGNKENIKDIHDIVKKESKYQ